MNSVKEERKGNKLAGEDKITHKVASFIQINFNTITLFTDPGVKFQSVSRFNYSAGNKSPM